MKPNKLEEAKAQMSKFLQGNNAIELPEEIATNEAHMYHVAVVESKGNAKTFEFEHKLLMKKFSTAAWEKIKDKFVHIGIKQVHILHNPDVMKNDLKKAEEQAKDQQAAQEKEEQEKIYAEAKEEAKKNLVEKAKADAAAEEKIKKEAEEAAKKEAKAKADAPAKEGLKEFQAMKEEAKALGMEVTNKTTKDEVAAFLQAKAEEAKAEFDKQA